MSTISEREIVDIFNLVLYSVVPVYRFSAVNLRKTRYSRAHFKASALKIGIFFELPRVICERRARTDKAHIALENIYELRQLIKAGRSYYFSDASHAAVALIRILTRSHMLRTDAHRAELVHFKNFSVFSEALLLENHGTF